MSHQSTGARFSYMNRTVVGGAACSEQMLKTFVEDYGVDVLHAWGMTGAFGGRCGNGDWFGGGWSGGCVWGWGWLGGGLQMGVGQHWGSIWLGWFDGGGGV
jgi:hypothetical protein